MAVTAICIKFVWNPSFNYSSEFNPITHIVFPADLSIHTASPRSGALPLIPSYSGLPRCQGTRSPSKPSRPSCVQSLMVLCSTQLWSILLFRLGHLIWQLQLSQNFKDWCLSFQNTMIFLSSWTFFISKAYTGHHIQVQLEYFRRHCSKSVQESIWGCWDLLYISSRAQRISHRCQTKQKAVVRYKKESPRKCSLYKEREKSSGSLSLETFQNCAVSGFHVLEGRAGTTDLCRPLQFPGSQQLLSSHPASPQALCMGKTTLLAIQSNKAPSPPPLWSLLQLIFLQSWTPPQSQPWVVAAMAMEEVGMTGLPNTKFQIHSLNQTISPKCLCHVLCLPALRVSRIKLPLILPSKIQNLVYLEVLLFTCQNVTEFIHVFF